MGLFDLPSPLFALVDKLVAWLPGIVGLAFWALLSAIATMWLYHRFSRQEELAEIKPKIKAVQKKMARYDGPMADLWPLIGESMRLSFRQMGMTLWPALIASLPILFVLVFLSNHYGHRFPAAGKSVLVQPEGAESPADWSWNGTHAEWLGANAGWRVTWPTDHATLSARDRKAVLALPPPAPSGVVHKRQWWNWLLGNPAGYLADDAPVDALKLDLPGQTFLNFGPDWIRGWEAPYLLLLVVFSLAIKIRFKIL